jgi:carbamoyltransferase
MDHHESHAASAFFPSPFEAAAILTLDGVGEWSTTAWGVGRGNRIELTHHLQFPHSLGLLYSAVNLLLWIQGQQRRIQADGSRAVWNTLLRRRHLQTPHRLKPDGSFWLNMDYFNYCQGLTMTNQRFHNLFGGPPRTRVKH